jgi:hypothetical protein
MSPRRPPQHKCARIRRGLYNYRGYNVRHYPSGWAVRDGDGKPWGSIERSLRRVCKTIDGWEAAIRRIAKWVEQRKREHDEREAEQS